MIGVGQGSEVYPSRAVGGGRFSKKGGIPTCSKYSGIILNRLTTSANIHCENAKYIFPFWKQIEKDQKEKFPSL